MKKKEFKKGKVYMNEYGSSFIYEGEGDECAIGTPITGIFEIREGRCLLGNREIMNPEEFIGKRIEDTGRGLMDMLIDVINAYGGYFTFENSETKKKVSVYDKRDNIIKVEDVISGDKSYIRETNIASIAGLLDEIRCYGGLKNEELGRY